MRTNKVSLDEEAKDYDYDQLEGEDFETVSKGAFIPGIQIRGLKKNYSTGLLRKSVSILIFFFKLHIQLFIYIYKYLL